VPDANAPAQNRGAAQWFDSASAPANAANHRRACRSLAAPGRRDLGPARVHALRNAGRTGDGSLGNQACPDVLADHLAVAAISRGRRPVAAGRLACAVHPRTRKPALVWRPSDRRTQSLWTCPGTRPPTAAWGLAAERADMQATCNRAAGNRFRHERGGPAAQSSQSTEPIRMLLRVNDPAERPGDTDGLWPRPARVRTPPTPSPAALRPPLRRTATSLGPCL